MLRQDENFQLSFSSTGSTKNTPRSEGEEEAAGHIIPSSEDEASGIVRKAFDKTLSPGDKDVDNLALSAFQNDPVKTNSLASRL